MPEIDKITEVTYASQWPYHFHYDNIPLTNILARIDLVNSQVDLNTNILRNSVGTAGTLDNRLAQSLEDSGDLKVTAIDDAAHNIAWHTDGTRADGTGGSVVAYVRMTGSERDKLSLIESEANNLDIEVESISTTEFITSGTARLRHSDTVTFSLTAPDIIKANTTFPLAAARQHYYDMAPAHVTPSSPDYKNYKTTSLGTAFVSGTLRVYVNGIRLSEDEYVYVYGSAGPDGTWVLTKIDSTTPASGLFTLNRSISSSDVIRIDWDSEY